MEKDLISPELKKQFEEAREYYRELLEGAKPIEPSALTVDRINSLNEQNKILWSSLLKVHSLVKKSKLPKAFKSEFESIVNFIK